MRRLLDRYRRHRARLSRGQSLTEFAIMLPAVLLIVLVAIDFGRVYLGWVNLQQMARIAANFAADNATAWVPPGDAGDQQRYDTMVGNDALFINCELPDTNGDGDPDVPDPIFGFGIAVGSPVVVNLECEFPIITPIISNVLGGTVLVAASVTYPIKEGFVSEVGGGSGPLIPVPDADFVGSPRTGWAPLDVTFLDLSSGATSQTWDFSVNPVGTNPSADPGTEFDPGPHTVTYDCGGSPGEFCTFSVRLTVSNPGGTDTKSVSDYIVVEVPPPTGPIAEFEGAPRSGVEPLTVDFQFVDLRGGTVNYASYDWDFGDGDTGTGQNPSHTYATAGEYDVTLTVIESGTGQTNDVTKGSYIVVQEKICTVPDFQGRRRNQANQIQNDWADEGFTGPVSFLPGNGNYVIQYQFPVGGVIDPRPDGCASSLTLGP